MNIDKGPLHWRVLAISLIFATFLGNPMAQEPADGNEGGAIIPSSNNLELLSGCNATMIEGKWVFTPDIFPGGEVDVTFRGRSSVDFDSLCTQAEKNAGCRIYGVVEIQSTAKCGTDPGDPSVAQVACRPDPLPTSGWPCGAEFKSKEDFTTIKKATLAAVHDSKIDGTQQVQLCLMYKKVVNGQVVVLGLEECCSVTVVDLDDVSGSRATNGRHIRTFDGTKLELQKYDKPAEFILYRHLIFPARADIIVRRCGKSQCICGVAIQAVEFTFVIDNCGPGPVQTRFLSPFATGANATIPTYSARIYGRQNVFDFFYLHGTEIRITAFDDNYVNVQIFPSAADFELTEGLCGFYDQNPDNDFRVVGGDTLPNNGAGSANAFARSWRVPLESSLSLGFTEINASPPQFPLYCRCANGEEQNEDGCPNGIECVADTILSDCDRIRPNTVQQAALVRQQEFNAITVPSGSLPILLPSPLGNQKPSRAAVPPFGSPRRNINEAQARQHCQNLFNSAIQTRPCLAVAEYGAEAYSDIDYWMEDVCIKDIEYTDSIDTPFFRGALRQFSINCGVIAASLPNAVFNQTIRDAILNNDCPSECNNRGTCINGFCNCNTGFAGLACQVTTDAVPKNLELLQGPFCDIRDSSRDCNRVLLLAGNILPGNDVKVHFEVQQCKRRSWWFKHANRVFTRTASLVTGTTVAVEINDPVGTPQQRAYFIRLSNSNSDNRMSSDSYATYITQDSNCWTCQALAPHDINEGVTPQCTLKPNTCFENGRCYTLGERISNRRRCRRQRPTPPWRPRPPARRNSCSSRPCQNRGLCIPRLSSGYRCFCYPSYSGTNCEKRAANPCDSQPCQNEGTCSSRGRRYRCACSRRYTGRNCERRRFTSSESSSSD